MNRLTHVFKEWLFQPKKDYKELLKLTVRPDKPTTVHDELCVDAAAFFYLMHCIMLSLYPAHDDYVTGMTIIKMHLVERGVGDKSSKINMVIPFVKGYKAPPTSPTSNTIYTKDDFDSQVLYVADDFAANNNPFVLPQKKNVWNRNAHSIDVTSLKARIWSLYLLNDTHIGTRPGTVAMKMTIIGSKPPDEPTLNRTGVIVMNMTIKGSAATGAVATGAVATGAVATGAVATGAVATGAVAKPGVISMNMTIKGAGNSEQAGGAECTGESCGYATIVQALHGIPGLQESLERAAKLTSQFEGDPSSGDAKMYMQMCALFYVTHIWCRAGVNGESDQYAQYMDKIYSEFSKTTWYNKDIGLAITLPWNTTAFYGHMLIVPINVAKSTRKQASDNPFIQVRRPNNVLSPQASVYSLERVRKWLIDTAQLGDCPTSVSSAFAVQATAKVSENVPVTKQLISNRIPPSKKKKIPPKEKPGVFKRFGNWFSSK